MDRKFVKMIRITIAVVMLIISFVIWMSLPNRVPIHFTTTEPDSYGNKQILLVLFFVLNLPTFIPWHSEKIEFHGNDVSEEMIKMIQEDEDKKVEWFHTLFTIIMSLITFLLLLAVKVHS